MNFRKLAKLSVAIAHDKKAEDMLIIDVRKLTAITDYFILLSGKSDIHVKTISDAIIMGLKDMGIRILHIEGESNARWILLDYGGVIIHIFYEPIRKFYNLERLWREGKKVSFKPVNRKITGMTKSKKRKRKGVKRGNKKRT